MQSFDTFVYSLLKEQVDTMKGVPLQPKVLTSWQMLKQPLSPYMDLRALSFITK